jgi:transposase
MKKKQILLRRSEFKRESKVMLSVNQRNLIKTHYENGKKIKQIARMMRICPKTVRRWIGRDNPQASTRAKGQNGKFLDENKSVIRELYLSHECNCVALSRTITERFGIKLNIRMLERFCKELRQVVKDDIAAEERSCRFETAPGEQLQIDFCEKEVIIAGAPLRVYFYVGILGYSRKVFAKAYLNHTLPSWLDGIESNFHYLGGLPASIVSDNESCLVNSQVRNGEKRFTERYMYFCDYYGVEPRRTAVRKPRSKGKVERAVQYVKNNALVGKTFDSMEHLNQWLEEWCMGEADERKIEHLPKDLNRPKDRFRIEQPKLSSFTKPRIANIRCEIRRVSANGLIRIDNANYSLPSEFINKEVQVFIDGLGIEVHLAGHDIVKLDKVDSVYTPLQQSQLRDAGTKLHTPLFDLSNAAFFISEPNPVGRDLRSYDAITNTLGVI